MPMHSSTAAAGHWPSAGIIGTAAVAAPLGCHMKLRVCRTRELGGFVIGEAEPDQTPTAPLVHVLLEPLDPDPPVDDGLLRPFACCQHDEGIVDGVRQAGGAASTS